MYYVMAAILATLAGCGGTTPAGGGDGTDMPPVALPDMAHASPDLTPACGAQGEACCTPGAAGGINTCSSGLTCDGEAFRSGTTSSTAGICGSVGGLGQPCDAHDGCFDPHVCMTADGVSSTCIDPAGGGLPGVCGNAGEACCSELTPSGQRGPAAWCHVGLHCTTGLCS